MLSAVCRTVVSFHRSAWPIMLLILRIFENGCWCLRRCGHSCRALGLTALAATTCILTTGCIVVPQNPHYEGPRERPTWLEEYYSRGDSYSSYKIEEVEKERRYTQKLITVQTSAGEISIDYYERPEPSRSLIFIFPILGGKHIIEAHFARYFAKQGYDAAIVHRDKDFKKTENFDQLEQIFRRNVIRDRIAIDFFEKELHKTEFGTFGISRGAINAAITAGVDPRLKHNVFALGASHLVEIFKHTKEPGVEKYRRRVLAEKGITRDEFYRILRQNIITDPAIVASFIDSRETLLILSAFDRSVPIKYGMRLRRELGTPRTVFLPSGHYTSVLFTQFIPLLPPITDFGIFPPDYIESEAVSFYNQRFTRKRYDFHHVPLKLLELPFEIIGRIYFAFVR